MLLHLGSVSIVLGLFFLFGRNGSSFDNSILVIFVSFLGKDGSSDKNLTLLKSLFCF